MLYMKNTTSKLYLWLYSFTFQLTPKARKYVERERQDNFSRKHENTLKSMEFLMLKTKIWHVTVAHGSQ